MLYKHTSTTPDQGAASGSGGPQSGRTKPDFGLRAELRDGFQNRAGIGMSNVSPIGMEVCGMDFRGRVGCPECRPVPQIMLNILFF